MFREFILSTVEYLRQRNEPYYEDLDEAVFQELEDLNWQIGNMRNLDPKSSALLPVVFLRNAVKVLKRDLFLNRNILLVLCLHLAQNQQLHQKVVAGKGGKRQNIKSFSSPKRVLRSSGSYKEKLRNRKTL